MAIYELDGQGPDLPADGNYFIADTATVIGKVRLKASASVWFGAVLRGDNEWIEIGEGSNVQDNCDLPHRSRLSARDRQELHHRPQRHPARLHVEDGALIGMGSIVMNGARIGRGSIVGAGSVITEGKEFPENSLIIGAPARVIRTLDADAGARRWAAPRVLSAPRAALQKRPEEDRAKTCNPVERFSRPASTAGSPWRWRRLSRALLRSASFRSIGMPCFFRRSAKASSASS